MRLKQTTRQASKREARILAAFGADIAFWAACAQFFDDTVTAAILAVFSVVMWVIVYSWDDRR